MKIILGLALLLCLFSGCGKKKAPTNPLPDLESLVVVNAGPDQVSLSGDTVVLNGAGSTTADHIQSFLWEQLGESVVILTDPASETVSFIAPEDSAGVLLTFILTAIDDQGNSATDSVSIKIEPHIQQKTTSGMVADFSSKTLFFPMKSTSTQDVAFNTSEDELIVNSDMHVISVDGNSDAIITLNNVGVGDRLDVIVEYQDSSESMVKQNWTLVFSGLPMVVISTKGAIVDEPKAQASITIIDLNAIESTNDRIFTSNMGIEVRGQASQKYPKKSFGLELWEEGGKDEEQAKEQNASLLGMRNDGDWILDAMFVDYSRMRNLVSMELWNDYARKLDWSDDNKQADSRYATEGKYVEVILNGQYHGIYVLSDKIDRKQVQVKKSKDGVARGLLYKAPGWGKTELGNNTKFETDPAAYTDTDLLWLGWEKKYPDESPEATWEPLYNLRNFIVNSTDGEFRDQVGGKVSLDNMIDYLLLLNLISGADNTGKNTFMAMYNYESDEVEDNKFFYIPWDMDATWGRFWTSGKIEPIHWHTNYLFNRLRVVNPNDYKAKVKQRWLQLRGDSFNRDNLIDRFKNFQEQLTQSGGMQREVERWGEDVILVNSEALDLDEELAYLDAWISGRVEWLDEYINLNF